MNVVIKEAKTEIDAIKYVSEELNCEVDNLIYKTKTIKGKLFKGTSTEVTAITKQDFLEYIKDFLKEIVENMGIEVKFEASIREDTYNIRIYSNNNPILIGRNGQTLKALETLLKQKALNDFAYYPKINLDVEDYKERRQKSLERLAKNVAREVRATKVEASLENMNSYERRIVHNCLTNFKGITTISEGEEPNRHVVIKPKED